ncbi:MAG: glycoside hydrolase family 1 protein [Acidimicrobiia bacterium]
MSYTFPDGFLWGTATAAHQVEGGNWNNDWWQWEHTPGSPCAEPSGDACDHWFRYPADIELLASLGFAAYRFSLEWSRVEPEDGEISRAALDHYRRMAACCRENELMPVVTFHHFTTPRWAAADGGWENPVTAERFARFCEHAGGALGDEIGIACTLNEPNIVNLMGWVMGMFPPGKTDDMSAYGRATATLIDGHRRAVDALKAGPGDFPVGLTLSMADWTADPGAEDMMRDYRHGHEDVFLEATRGDDFVGVQAYHRTHVTAAGAVDISRGEGDERLPMGYGYWPQALAGAVRHAVEVAGVPVYVTENGIGTNDDEQRIRYLEASLTRLTECIEVGIDVRGYFCWSALDNFEWTYGYGPKFGIIAVDRETQTRTPKPSAKWFGDIARTNRLG